MTTDTTAARAALIDALRKAAEAATDGWTHVTLCSNDVHLRAARRWRPDCAGCGQPIPNGNVGPLTWCDEGGCHYGTYNHQHGCGAWNSPTEVEIDLSEAIPDEVEVDDLPWWADEIAAELVARVIGMLDRQCADEQQNEAERIEQQLRDQIREARTVLAANAARDGDPIGRYLAAERRYHEAADLIEREAAKAVMDEAASLLAIWEIAVNPDAMEQGGVYLDTATGRLAAWDWDPRSYSDVIEVYED